MAFNENTRVKLPAILHLCRLGYKYLPLSKSNWDVETNIFTDIFKDSVKRINPDIEDSDINRLLQDVSLMLDNEDLGEAFYQKLISTSGIRLLDHSSPENFKKNNSFHVVTELPCKNGDEEFRPDITLLINGMPLAFIEVKKPNNQEGVLAERERINTRFKNKKFRKFINISQVLVFSNNMEYDTESIEPIQGAFYSTTSYSTANFNCFREEETFDLSSLLLPEVDDLENFVLKDNNLSAIKHSPEFITNKEPNTPTNRILTSLFCTERLWSLNSSWTTTLVWDSGNVSAGTNGLKKITASQTNLPPGAYMLGTLCEATTGFRYHYSAMTTFFASTSSIPTYGASIPIIDISHTYGTLPTSPTIAVSGSGETYTPAVMVTSEA